MMYRNITNQSAVECGFSQSQHGADAEAFTKAFVKNSIPHMKDAAVEDMLARKAVVLEYKRPKKKVKKRKAKGLNAKERRRLKIFQLKPEHQKYVFEVSFQLDAYTLFYIIEMYCVKSSACCMIVDINSSCLCTTCGKAILRICAMD